MATGDRSKRIRSNVQRVLNNRGETREEGLGLAIYEAGDRIQRRIADETLCLETTLDDITVANEELYSLPDDFISERAVRVDGSLPVIKINRDKFVSLKRMLASEDTSDESASDLVYYYIWENQIGFLIASGAAPSSAITFHIDYWRYPSTSEKLSDTKDPVVDRRWDDCIFKGIVAEMMIDAKWYALYEESFQRAKGVEDARSTEALQIPYAEGYD